MATLQELIDFLDRKYPNHGESNANIVLDLDMIHKDIFMRLQRLKNDYKIDEVSSVTNQTLYNLPTGVKIEDVFQVTVSVDTLGTVFETYSLRGIKDTDDVGRYYGRGSEGTFFIINNKLPLKQDGLSIHVYYFARPADLSATTLTQVPDLDPDYHDLLRFGIVQEIASQGHNPDTTIANYYQLKFDEKFERVRKDIESKMQKAPLRIPQVKERW